MDVKSNKLKKKTSRQHLPAFSLQSLLRVKPCAFDGSKLSLVGSNINFIDILPSRIAMKIKIIYLSNNNICDIHNIAQFNNCSQLSLANNSIKYLGDLIFLRELAFLEKLNLEGNVVSEMPYFRETVLSFCTKLNSLNGTKVGAQERSNLRSRMRKITTLLNQLRLNELRLVITEHYIFLSRCHAELGKFRQYIFSIYFSFVFLR